MTSPEAPPRTAAEMLARGRAFLEQKGCEEARLDAELLVAHALDLDRLRLFLALDRPLDEADVTRGRELLVRRSKGEPVAYLTGRREFYARAFRVGPGVLVPRPETELLVDRARELARELRGSEPVEGSEGGGAADARGDVLEDASGAPALKRGTDARDYRGLRIGEVGVGSGCIAVTLALELPGSEVQGVELSERALEYARENAERLGATLKLCLGDGPEALDGPLDLLVSNPPYVVHPDDAVGDAPGNAPRGAVSARADASVVAHEPHEALFAPLGDPDHWVQRLRAAAESLLAPGGVLLVELGADQAARLTGQPGMRIHRDLAGHARLYEWRKPL